MGKGLRMGVLVLLAAMVGWWLIPRPPLFEGLGYSFALHDRQGSLLRLTLAGDQSYRLRVPLDRIAPEMIEATLLYEDRGFYRHIGVAPLALLRAAWRTYGPDGRREGGSTITMQLARLRFGLRSHSLWGKLIQITRALQLERHYSKAEILEAYLTLAPYGGNIEGVAAAALIYFGKTPDRLTLPEALTLSVIPQSPNRHAPRRFPGRVAELEPTGEPVPLVRARAALFEQWVRRHPKDSIWRTRLGQPVVGPLPNALPFRAPHFTTALLKGLNRSRASIASGGKTFAITTTLDGELQAMLERQVGAYVERYRSQGLHNAAALLVETRSLAVRALVGSADFFDPTIDGQVDGTAAPRSPGSTLKPFLYGMAMDQGLVHPQTVLKDAPVGYGVYDPENFDGDFQGPITVREALIRSRNIPALQVAERLEAPGFHRLLAEAGIGGLRDAGHYGLAVVLGGVEVTMRELTALYAMLGNGGVHRPLRLNQDAPGAEEAGRRLLSPEATAIILDILKDNPHPSLPSGNLWRRNRLPVHWKTGTSYAYRDAWAVGLFGSYVLAVWVGNFDGRGHPALIGRQAAAPLFFRIVDALQALEPGMEATPWPKGLNLRKVDVCAASGGIPGPYCPVTVPSWFIPGVSPIRPDTVFREVRIDPRTGLRACPGDVGVMRRAVYEFWSTDLLDIFREAGIPRRTPPPFPRRCRLVAEGGLPPEITSPKKNVVYQLRKDRSSPIMLRAVTDADVRRLYWFLDTRFLGETPIGRAFFWTPSPGRYQLRVVDDQGRSDVRRFIVEAVD